MLIDHEYIEHTVWPNGDEVWSYVTEPYQAEGKELIDFIQRCRLFGLEVAITTGGRHNAGCIRIEAMRVRRAA